MKTIDPSILVALAGPRRWPERANTTRQEILYGRPCTVHYSATGARALILVPPDLPGERREKNEPHPH